MTIKFMVRDDFLERDVELFDTQDDAVQAALAYGEHGTVVEVTDDPEEDALYAPGLFGATETPSRHEIDDWADASRGYWVMADEARKRRQWREMRQAAQLAESAETASDRVINAIFFSDTPGLSKDAREAAQLGRRVGKERAQSARLAVRDETKRHNASAKARREAEIKARREADKAQRRRWDDEQRAKLPPVGEVVEAEQSYRLQKNAPNVVIVRHGGEVFYAQIKGVVDAPWKGTVRVTAHKKGRIYGHKFDFMAET